MRLIDADELTTALNGYQHHITLIKKKNRKTEEAILRDVKGIINSVPTIEEQKKDNWVPIETRPMDEDERKEWSEKLGYELEDYEAVIYMSLPDDGQEVLTCSQYGHIAIDKFENDPDYGCCFEENGDMDGIVAWMPLPEP